MHSLQKNKNEKLEKNKEEKKGGTDKEERNWKKQSKDENELCKFVFPIIVFFIGNISHKCSTIPSKILYKLNKKLNYVC